MITDLELERIAAAIDRALPRSGNKADWTQVERLRLQSDLLDRLAAAQRNWSGSLSRQAEIVRDSAERLADELTKVSGALASSTSAREGVAERGSREAGHPRRVTHFGTLPRQGEAVPSGPGW